MSRPAARPPRRLGISGGLVGFAKVREGVRFVVAMAERPGTT